MPVILIESHQDLKLKFSLRQQLQGKGNLQLQTTNWNQNQATLMGGEHPHHCTILAPTLKEIQSQHFA